MVFYPSWSTVCFMDNRHRSNPSYCFLEKPPSWTVVCITDKRLRSYHSVAWLISIYHAQSLFSSMIIRNFTFCFGLWTDINFDQWFFSSEFLHDHVIQLIFVIYIQQDQLFVWWIPKSYLIIPQVSRINIRHDQTFLHR